MHSRLSVVVVLALGLIGCLAQDELAPVPAPVTVDGAEDLVPLWNKPRITVCTSEWTPMVYCVNKTAAEYTGFEIEFFRGVASKLGWKDTMIDWKCMGWDEMKTDIVANKGTFGNGTCDFAVAGFAAVPNLDREGLEFTWPSTRVGKRLMVMGEEQQPDGWFFLSAISTEVWILLIITSVVTGLITWLAEVGSEALNADTRWLSNVMWDTIGRPVQMRDYRLSSTAANIIAFVWSFLVFISMAMYTANLTANLTTQSITSQIKSLSDLPGKSVGTWEFYTDDLEKYNIKAKPYPWNNEEDELFMIDQLRKGYITALVMESSMLSNRDATMCDTLLIGDIFDAVDVVAAFPNGFDRPEILTRYNEAVIEVLEEGLDEALTARFINVQQAPCKQSQFDQQAMQVEFSQVSGLWIMLAAAVGVGALLVAWRWYWIKWGRPSCEQSCCGTGYKNTAKKIDDLSTHMMTIGSGTKRTPKSYQPRIALKSAQTMAERNQELWEDHYDGASTGYLEGSADAPSMNARLRYGRDIHLPPLNESMEREAFEQELLKELRGLRTVVNKLQKDQILAAVNAEPAVVSTQDVRRKATKSYAVKFSDDVEDDDSPPV